MKKLDDIVFVLDESGSMGINGKYDAAIHSFNTFLSDQQKEDRSAVFTLYTFSGPDNIKRKCSAINIKECGPLSRLTYAPNDSTALYDAIGIAIDETGARLAALPACERPEKVIVAILTDGEENTSRLHTLQAVREKISHQTQKYSWTFMFLSSSLRGEKTSQDIGISPKFYCGFTDNAKGLREATFKCSAVTSSIRHSASASEAIGYADVQV